MVLPLTAGCEASFPTWMLDNRQGVADTELLKGGRAR